MKRESQLVASISSLLPRLYHLAMIWRNNTGQITVEDRVIRFGKVGASDFIGLASNGRLLAIECKSPHGRLTHEQHVFLTQINRKGGYGCAVRSVDEFIVAVTRAIRGEIPPQLEKALPPKKRKAPAKSNESFTRKAAA